MPGARRITAASLMALATSALAGPPQFLQVVREPITAGREQAYEAVESETAVACVTLKCPHPHLALETLVDPTVVWWFNFFDSEAQRLAVTRAYEGNDSLMETLRRNSERKSRYTGDVSDTILRHRPDLDGDSTWAIAGARFVVVSISRSERRADGPVFEAPDGTYYAVQPRRTLEEAERAVRDAADIVLRIRPTWGLPAQEWIDADPDFWSANPAIWAVK
jgi:hypothetical protein